MTKLKVFFKLLKMWLYFSIFEPIKHFDSYNFYCEPQLHLN